jgi:NADPH:quinone reductase-like Zn-dependent oxidoreductase
MKAAVLHQFGGVPVYEEFPDPVPASADQLLLTVKAAAIKNLDKLRASGTHYASYKEVPVVVGIDGVGFMENGTRVYAQGITGTIAEKALIARDKYIPLPAGIPDELAAAIPNAAMGSAIALLYRGQLKKGEVVLINGATGVTGQMAVQLARHYGAARIIATGRNAHTLQELSRLGADEVISLRQDDEAIVKKLKETHAATPIDLVIDYLWGRPVELLLNALKSGGIGVYTHRVRIVTVGSTAGENISLNSGILRSSAIEILGSGLGSISEESFRLFNTVILPELFELAGAGKLRLETVTADIKDIANVWHKEMEGGKRLVVKI